MSTYVLSWTPRYDSCAEALKHDLKKFTMGTLDVGNQELGDDRATTLAKVLRTCTNLKSLSVIYLNNSGIGDAGAVALAHALSIGTHLSALTVLQLSVNRIGDMGAKAIAEAMENGEHLTALSALDLSNNCIGDTGAVALAKSLVVGTHLRVFSNLILSNNGIGQRGAGALAGALENGANLTSFSVLNMCKNNIGDAGAIALAVAIERGTHLTALSSLSLSDNGIGDEGAVALSHAMEKSKHLRSLTTLILRRNRIGDDGAETLALALEKGTHLDSLQTLDLGGNRIGETGAVALAMTRMCFSHLGNLGSIILTWNGFGQRAAQALAILTYDNTVDLGLDSITSEQARIRSLWGDEVPVDATCVRAVLCGEPGAGKTQIVMAREGTVGLPRLPVNSRTAGISLSRWQVNDMEVSIWDFAGHEEYRCTHSLFMSGSSTVYVIVANAALGEESVGEQLTRWLRFIASQQVAHKPPVLVVLTHADEVAELGRNRNHFMHVVDKSTRVFAKRLRVDPTAFCFVDALNDVSSVWSAVHVQATQLLTDPRGWRRKVPKAAALLLEWLPLWRKSHKWMTWRDFEARCVEDIPELAMHGMNRVERGVRFLHEIGEVIYFADHNVLCDIVIVNPAWLVGSVLADLLLPDGATRTKDGFVASKGKKAKLSPQGHLTAIAYDCGMEFDALVNLLDRMEVLYRDDSAPEEIFLPAQFRNKRIVLEGASKCRAVLGRRLTVKDKGTVMLTPGVFPRLHWRLHAKFRELPRRRSRDAALVDHNGVQVLVQLLDMGSGVDILAVSQHGSLVVVREVVDDIMGMVQELASVDLVEQVVSTAAVRKGEAPVNGQCTIDLAELVERHEREVGTATNATCGRTRGRTSCSV